MANKLAGNGTSSASNDAFSDLEQLRLIVFGHAKQELESKIEDLQMRFTKELTNLQSQFDKRHTELLEKMSEQQQELLTKLESADQAHNENEAELKEELNNAVASLSSQLEIAENASNDDSLALHKRLDQEVDDINTSIAKAIAELSDKLDTMNSNLATSKTDRKILAKLLANVATNLDADD